jgi:hypothetical protein
MEELSPATLLALQQFMGQKDTEEKKFAELKKSSELNFETLKMQDFAEDWNLSQFWYSNDTADDLAKMASTSKRIACIACPSTFLALKRAGTKANVTLFEYDPRFEVFGSDFHMYDFNAPLKLDESLLASFDTIYADPPFLSEVYCVLL